MIVQQLRIEVKFSLNQYNFLDSLIIFKNIFFSVLKNYQKLGYIYIYIY
jgi:hypothetical protein